MKNRLVEENKYGWVICFAAALLLFCTGGLGTTGFSVYQPYLINLRGLSNTQSSTMLTVRSLFTLIGMAVTSKVIDSFGIKRTITAAMAISAASFLAYGLTATASGCYLGAALAGTALGVGGMVPASILISRWFNDHRGLALGICMSATGLSAMAASPIITYLIAKYSLRTAFLAEAVFVFAAGLVIYRITYSRPSCIHTEPVGEKAQEGGVSKVFAAHTTDRALMVMMMVGILLFGMSANALCPHISVLYSSEGMDNSSVSLLTSLMGLFLAAGKCAYGGIADKLGVVRASVLLYVMVSAGTLLCTLAGSGIFIIAVIAVALLSFGLAVTTVSISMFAGKVSTEREYDGTVTRFQFISSLGGLLFTSVPGMMADRTGSYVHSFWVMFVLVVLGSAIQIATYRRIRHNDHIYVREHPVRNVNLRQLH